MARILIVDDQPFNVELLEQELDSLDYDTDTAFDGQQALDRVAANKPDLILLDVMMPVLDGFTVCRILKADPSTQLIPIIIMTALDDIDDRIEGIEAGADDFLTKPVDERELKARIETALRLKEAMEARIDKAGKAGKHYEKFVPEAVKRRVEANPEAPNLEKRDEDASVLFLDIVGYTRLSERLPPAELTALVERYFSVFMDKLHGRDGDIVESSGDGLMVLFQGEDPAGHANRAIEAAREIFDEARRMNADSNDPDVALHMGINSGLASVGSTRYEGASGTRWVFTADGFVVNLASRLAGVAEAGELCIGEETAARVADLWEFEDIGLKTMKNVAEPTRVYKVVGPRQADKPSVVVLPFDNPDGEAEHKLLCDGLTEDLIADLSRVEGLLVIAPNSAQTFSAGVQPATVCCELAVGHALLGSLRQSDFGVRIEARLLDEDGKTLWELSQRDELDQLFEMRDKIVHGALEAMDVAITDDDAHRLSKRPRIAFDAWKPYLRALGCHRTFSREGNEIALRRFDLALSKQPEFARAIAMKSRANLLFFVNNWGDDPQGSLDTAHRLAREAVQADPDEPIAYTSLSASLLWKRQLDDAKQACLWALQREPNNAIAHCNLGSIHHYLGEHEKGLEYMDRALRLDPNCPPMFLHFTAQCQYGCRRYREAAATLNKRLSRSSASDVSRVLLAACYGQMGEFERAKEQWEEALAVNPDYSLAQKREALPYANPADFEHMVEGLRKAGIDVD